MIRWLVEVWKRFLGVVQHKAERGADNIYELETEDQKNSEWSLATGNNLDPWCNWRDSWDTQVVEY